MTLEEIRKLFEEFNQPWYCRLDFWIGSVISIILGAVGLFYSIKSFNEARLAKKEAELAKLEAGKASNTVKIQSIIIELGDISRLCQLNFNTDYVTASINFNEISSKVKYIFGLFHAQLNDKHSELLTKLEGNLSTIRAALNTINPIQNPTLTDVPNVVYYTLEQHFSELRINLGELKGVLERELI